MRMVTSAATSPGAGLSGTDSEARVLDRYVHNDRLRDALDSQASAARMRRGSTP
jgi:hypothetical protein